MYQDGLAEWETVENARIPEGCLEFVDDYVGLYGLEGMEHVGEEISHAMGVSAEEADLIIAKWWNKYDHALVIELRMSREEKIIL